MQNPGNTIQLFKYLNSLSTHLFFRLLKKQCILLYWCLYFKTQWDIGTHFPMLFCGIFFFIFVTLSLVSLILWDAISTYEPQGHFLLNKYFLRLISDKQESGKTYPVNSKRKKKEFIKNLEKRALCLLSWTHYGFCRSAFSFEEHWH